MTVVSKATLQDRKTICIELKGNDGMEVVYALSVPHFDGYFATTCGRIVSYWNSYNGTEASKRPTNPIFLKEQVNPVNGYHSVVLYNSCGGKRQARKEYVHRIIAKTFLEMPPNFESFDASTGEYVDSPRTEVNHIDCNKANNKVANLEWVCKRENQHHYQVMKTLGLDDEYESDTDKAN
jgi:hypothetical protein